MTPGLPIPPASASPEAHADWLEVGTLVVHDRSTSFEDLVTVVRRSGTTDVVGQDGPLDDVIDRGAEKAQVVAEDAFHSIELRDQACGGEYPFEVRAQSISLVPDGEETVYVFLLLLSAFGKDAGPPGSSGAELFEDVCVEAAVSYFGGADRGAGSYKFGFPRRLDRSGFVTALDSMTSLLGEGAGAKRRPESVGQKDAHLDIAVWRHFPDFRAGKLIGFGQCATGANWESKIFELHPAKWCQIWMNEMVPVEPVPMLFIPFSHGVRMWDVRSAYGGIIFDRARISHHASRASASVKTRCAEWSRHVISHGALA